MEDKSNLTWEKGLERLKDKLIFKDEVEKQEFLKPANNDIPIEDVFNEEMSAVIKEIESKN